MEAIRAWLPNCIRGLAEYNAAVKTTKKLCGGLVAYIGKP